MYCAGGKCVHSFADIFHLPVLDNHVVPSPPPLLSPRHPSIHPFIKPPILSPLLIPTHLIKLLSLFIALGVPFAIILRIIIIESVPFGPFLSIFKSTEMRYVRSTFHCRNSAHTDGAAYHCKPLSRSHRSYGHMHRHMSRRHLWWLRRFVVRCSSRGICNCHNWTVYVC